MAANPPPVGFAEKVAAATAPDRDRFIDAVRGRQPAGPVPGADGDGHAGARPGLPVAPAPAAVGRRGPFSSMAMTVYLWHLSVLVVAFLALFGLGIDPPDAGSGLWWLTRPFWLLGLCLVLLGVATLLSPLERGRTGRARAKSMATATATATRQPATQTSTVMATGISGVGAALISFGLLGYVASGLEPASHGSSTLLFVPVDPIQNTVCVLLGLALSTLAARWSPGQGQPR